MTLRQYASQLGAESIGEWNRMTVAERKAEVAAHNRWLKKQKTLAKTAAKRQVAAQKQVAKAAARYTPRKTRTDQSSLTPESVWGDWFPR